MTVRELINTLLTYDADERIDFLLYEESEKVIEITEVSRQSNLPWIGLKEIERG